MATLTPGVLSKLLQNAGNKDVKVSGQHRSPLLQVIEIVPSLAGAGDDPLRSSGFFIKVSDSLHSAYVSVSEEDVDLIYSDKIQLGQFVHVSRLDLSGSSPVPLLRGIKPLPRRRPCVGTPKDLVSSDLLPVRKSFDFSKPSSKNGLVGFSKKNVSVNANAKKRDIKKAKRLVSDEAKSRRASFGDGGGGRMVGGGGGGGGLELRRLSLDSARRGWDQSSPTPKTTNAAPPATPSRFKSSKGSSTSSHPNASPVVSDRKASSQKDSLPKRPNITTTPLKPKNESFQVNSNNSPLKKEQLKSSSGVNIPIQLTKLPLNMTTWCNKKPFWDLLPPTIHELGKGVVSRRNVAYLAAVNALEEASAAEGIIQCMSMFAELCESSQSDSPGPVVEFFLNLYQSMQKAAKVIDAFTHTSSPDLKATTCGSQCLSPKAYKTFANKDSTLWVQAAVETNLSKFCLFKTQGKKEILNGEKCHYVVLENTPNQTMSVDHIPQSKKSPRYDHGDFLSDGSARGMQSSSRRRLSATKIMNTEREVWSKGSGLKDAANLAGKLLLVSHGWFLKYLEDSLDHGFRLRGEEGKVDNACLLGQLKRVNQWLDDSVGDGNEVDERIEGLKKKLYGFLLEHVDSTAAP